MRTISVSTATFARIWALRKEGEDTEDVILRRILDVPKEETPEDAAGSGVANSRDGFHDQRYNAHFSEGMEIFRIYKGEDYRARATKLRWLLLNNNKLYLSLHKLSRAVVGGHENSWMNWKYLRSDGSAGLIDELRDQSKVQTRKSALSLEEL